MQSVVVSWVIGMFLIITFYVVILLQYQSLIGDLFWLVTFFCMFYFGVFINISMRFWGGRIAKIAKAKYQTYFDFIYLEDTKKLVGFLAMVSNPELDVLGRKYFFFRRLALANVALLFLNIVVIMYSNPI